MYQLPNELVGLLCSYLTNSSLKCFRLTCKAFANIGEEYLFQDFEFRLYPNYHRLYQLEQLAANSSIAARLTCLSLESGVQLEYADYRYWQAQVYQHVSSNWARGLGAKGVTNDEYEDFHKKLQARFTPEMPDRYVLYRWHLDQEYAFLAQRRMRDILTCTMNALHEKNACFHLKIIMTEPEVSLEELEAFDPSQFAHGTRTDPDPRRRVANRRKNCLDHFMNFLDAAQLSKCNVSELVGLDVPNELLTVGSHHDPDTLADIFTRLTKLNMELNGFPHSDWLSRGGVYGDVYYGGRNLAARRLSSLLNHATRLENLRLEFPQGKEAEYSYDLFDRTNIDRYPRLWSPHIRSLALCRIRCTWEDLRVLLQECKNLQSLSLSNCRLESGSMLDFLHFIPTMKLQRISIQGTWYVDDDSGEWHSHNRNDFTDCFAKTSYEGPYAVTGFRSKIETFLLEGGTCPLPKWTPAGREENTWEISGDTSWHYLPGVPRY